MSSSPRSAHEHRTASATFAAPSIPRFEPPKEWPPPVGARLSAWRSIPLRENERRQSPRRSLRCEISMLDDHGVIDEALERVMIPGECLNVGDGGLYGAVPLGYGVATGQHYTIRLRIRERGPEPGAHQVVVQQGRILRAELLCGDDDGEDRVGVAVQFYGHRNGVIPMPTGVIE